MPSTRSPQLFFVALFSALMAGSVERPLLANEPDTSHPIRVNNPRRIGKWSLPAERFAIGPGYKPSMAQLPTGELVMVALFGEQHEGKRREWTGLWRSTDDGQTWTDLHRVTDLIGREQWLTCISDGTLFATCHLLSRDWNNKNGVTHSYIHRSTDNGHTWERTRIAGKKFEPNAYTMCSRNVVEKPDGTLLLGVGLNGVPGRVAFIWTSKDRGKTWESGPQVKFGQYQDKIYDNFDCFFTEDFTYLTEKGSLLHWIRCGPPSPMHPMNDGRPVPTGNDSIDRTMFCYSVDDGLTCSDVYDFGESAHDLHAARTTVPDRAASTFELQRRRQLGFQKRPDRHRGEDPMGNGAGRWLRQHPTARRRGADLMLLVPRGGQEHVRRGGTLAVAEVKEE